VCGSVNAIGRADKRKMMDPKYLPRFLHGALILAAAVAVSGVFGNVWVSALALLVFVLVMMLMLHIMHGCGRSGVRARSSRSSQQRTDQLWAVSDGPAIRGIEEASVSNGVVLLPNRPVDHRVSSTRPLRTVPMLWEVSTHPGQRRRRP
jgi:hypothetical protein